ncbi:MAG TPA: M23 family metallopeptidase [Candidatus Dormibacteraeota bacterium]|nr:M23 family metallopeptidase [Candidatus Dormibacteraeota bacterium]
MSLRVLLVTLAGLGLMTLSGVHPSPGELANAGAIAPHRLAWPITNWVLTQTYGCTSFELEPAASWCPTGHFHSGLDLAAPVGAPIHAAAGGVARAGEDPGGYGLYVVVDHGGRVSTLYGHLAWTPLGKGVVVRAGDELGFVGSSGLSTGPHLHFEVRRDGRSVDPMPWLPGRVTGGDRDGQQGDPDRQAGGRS